MFCIVMKMQTAEEAIPKLSESFWPEEDDEVVESKDSARHGFYSARKDPAACNSPLNRWILSTLRSETGNEEMKETLSELIVADSPRSFFKGDTPQASITPFTHLREEHSGFSSRLSTNLRKQSPGGNKGLRSPHSAKNDLNSSKASVYLMDQVKHLSSRLYESEKKVSDVCDGREQAEAHIAVLERELKAAREALILMGEEAKEALEGLYVLSVNQIEQTSTPKPLKQPASTMQKPSRPLPWESNNAGHRHRKALEEEITYYKRKAQLFERKLQKERAQRVKQHVDHLNSLSQISEYSAPDREKVQAEMDATVFRLQQENNHKLTNLEVLLKKSRSTLNEEKMKNKSLQREITALKTKLRERVQKEHDSTRVSTNHRAIQSRARSGSEEKLERTPRPHKDQKKLRQSRDEITITKKLQDSLHAATMEKKALEQKLSEVVATTSRLEDNCTEFKKTVAALKEETVSLKVSNLAHENEISRLRNENERYAATFNSEIETLRLSMRKSSEEERVNATSQISSDLSSKTVEMDSDRSMQAKPGYRVGSNKQAYRGLLQLVDDTSRSKPRAKEILSSDW